MPELATIWFVIDVGRELTTPRQSLLVYREAPALMKSATGDGRRYRRVRLPLLRTTFDNHPEKPTRPIESTVPVGDLACRIGHFARGLGVYG